MNNLLILPGHPDFDWWLSQPPPSYRTDKALVADQFGNMREANEKQLQEYLFGGEYDERLEVLENGDFY
jgi:hypothetical protein